MSTSNFPTSLDDSASLPNPTTSSATNSPSHAALHTAENDAIEALESKVGTGATVPAANTMMRGTGAGVSEWGQVSSAEFAAILTDSVGSGYAVFNDSPTLITPSVDTINESTTDNGVTIDGVNIKDGQITTSGAVGTDTLTDSAITSAKMDATGFMYDSYSGSALSAPGEFNYTNTKTYDVTNIPTGHLFAVTVSGFSGSSTATNIGVLVGYNSVNYSQNNYAQYHISAAITVLLQKVSGQNTVTVSRGGSAASQAINTQLAQIN